MDARCRSPLRSAFTMSVCTHLAGRVATDGEPWCSAVDGMLVVIRCGMGNEFSCVRVADFVVIGWWIWLPGEVERSRALMPAQRRDCWRHMPAEGSPALGRDADGDDGGGTRRAARRRRPACRRGSMGTGCSTPGVVRRGRGGRGARRPGGGRGGRWRRTRGRRR
jgi:hypothetical protein